MVFVEFAWHVGDGSCFLFDDIADGSADDDGVVDGHVALCCTVGIVVSVVEGVFCFPFP